MLYEINKKISILCILLALVLLPIETGNAATDGSAGATSTGVASISLSIPKLIRARGFVDFTPSTYSGTGQRSASGDLNISANYGSSSRTYQVVATGSGLGGAFTISDGLGNEISYRAYYNYVTGITGRTELTAGVTLTGQTGAVKPLTNSTNNANLSINFLQSQLQAAVAGTYSGTLSVVFTPE